MHKCSQKVESFTCCFHRLLLRGESLVPFCIAERSGFDKYVKCPSYFLACGRCWWLLSTVLAHHDCSRNSIYNLNRSIWYCKKCKGGGLQLYLIHPLLVFYYWDCQCCPHQTFPFLPPAGSPWAVHCEHSWVPKNDKDPNLTWWVILISWTAHRL